MKTLITLLAFMPVAFVACDRDNKDNPVAKAAKNVEERFKDKDLQDKNFVSDCTDKPLEFILTGVLTGGTSPIKASRTLYRVEGATITRSTRLYNSRDCSGDVAYMFNEQGEVTGKPDQKTADNSKFIDIDYKTLKVKIITPEGATAANAIGLCGKTDWAKDQEVDVTAKAQDNLCYNAKLPRHVANVYKIEKDVLYIGTQTKAETLAADRPTAVNLNDKYVLTK